MEIRRSWERRGTLFPSDGSRPCAKGRGGGREGAILFCLPWQLLEIGLRTNQFTSKDSFTFVDWLKAHQHNNEINVFL